jgi:tetratricopeptide (TPR) repeat protein
MLPLGDGAAAGVPAGAALAGARHAEDEITTLARERLRGATAGNAGHCRRRRGGHGRRMHKSRQATRDVPSVHQGFTPPWRVLLLAALGALTLLAPTARAQVFSADRYLQECLRFEAGGDLSTARQSCLNALQADPRSIATELALARIETALGEHGAAETRLNRIRGQVATPEPTVLLAEIAYAGERWDEVAIHLARARAELTVAPDASLIARIAYLEGRLAIRDGRVNDALVGYAEAIGFDGLNVAYRLADATLRFRLGDVVGARSQLDAYESISGDVRNAAVKSLQGRLLWATGEVAAARDLLESALALRGLRDSAAQADDLRVLALLYYAQGDFDSGGIALREASRRGNLVGQVTTNAVLWVLAVVVLLGLILMAESRRASVVPDSGGEPPPWTLGEAYGTLLAAALLGLAASLTFSTLWQGNVLALLTPLQRQDALAVYAIVFAAAAGLLAWRRVRRAGIEPAPYLLGPSGQLVNGVLLGLGLCLAMLAYLAYVPRGGVFGSFLFDLARPTPLVVAALVLLPLAEFTHRGLLQPSLTRRYGSGQAVGIAGLVWAIAYGTPVLALVASGLALAEATRRKPGGLIAFVAVLVGWLSLLLLAALVPQVRGLFLS